MAVCELRSHGDGDKSGALSWRTDVRTGIDLLKGAVRNRTLPLGGMDGEANVTFRLLGLTCANNILDICMLRRENSLNSFRAYFIAPPSQQIDEKLAI